MDFILDVVALRKEPLQLAEVLEGLGYKPVPESRNFQFVKDIPGSKETMRIEFMAPEEFKRRADFRVDIQDGVHARACTGGSIALAESDSRTISGKLPDGTSHTAKVRVTRPRALVMLKLLALSDRYNNLRGLKEARHDREAQTHAADIVAILTAVTDIPAFNNQFVRQFHRDASLGLHVLWILREYFREATSPGLLVYSEHVAAGLPQDREASELLQTEIERARSLVAQFCPSHAEPRQGLSLSRHKQGGGLISAHAVRQFLQQFSGFRPERTTSPLIALPVKTCAQWPVEINIFDF